MEEIIDEVERGDFSDFIPANDEFELEKLKLSARRDLEKIKKSIPKKVFTDSETKKWLLDKGYIVVSILQNI
ncbi:MAG: hypothetical protein LBB10_00355 [Bifidobacteriaceae bacterium]|jgi:hypothetical protein|nr:hypothetical protein [Bifidobacteriaceae bacterium]